MLGIEKKTIEYDTVNYCDIFIYAKKVEGWSNKSIKYYKSTIGNILKIINKRMKHIITWDLRKYLEDSWLEEENYILKNLARRIYKIKTEKIIKEAKFYRY